LKRKLKHRTAHGASIILVALFALGLIILVFVAFQFAMVMGGSREVRNAVDAAALNIAKRSIEIQVPAVAGFRDVANTQGNVGLSNLSRTWGKAFLINANVQDMQNTGQITDAATANGNLAYEAAQTTNDAICNGLKNKGGLDNYFNDMAMNKNATLLGGSSIVTSQSDQAAQNKDFATAMVDRGDESNLSFSAAQLPKGVTLTGVKRGNNEYIQGYVPFMTNGKEFCVPTFHLNEQPHLISDDYFTKNRSDLAGLPGNPIPNAFKESGLASGTNNSLIASACAVANPQRQYTLAIPYSFVAISFSNQALWYVNGKKVAQTSYANEPQQYFQVKHYQPLPNGGFLDGSANLGNEYKAANLWMLYNALQGDHQTPLLKVVQRVQEIDPTFTMQRLEGLMQSQALKAGTNTPPVRYLIYPTYSTPDCTSPKIQIADSSSGNIPSWLARAAMGEGMGMAVSTEDSEKDIPNTCLEQITGGKNPSGKHWTILSGIIGFQPGTGYGQCLGELHIHRATNVYFTDEPEN